MVQFMILRGKRFSRMHGLILVTRLGKQFPLTSEKNSLFSIKP